MNIYATKAAFLAWDSLPEGQRARTLAATYFVPQKLGDDGAEDNSYKLNAVNNIAAAQAEKAFCSQWQQFLGSLPAEHSRSLTATPQSRLLVNLSGSVLENAGLAMEYICGVPVIPGSAVKGAARRYATALIQETEDPAARRELLTLYLAVFGCVTADYAADGELQQLLRAEEIAAFPACNRRGAVYFLQAVPQSLPTVTCEVQTPHHAEYMASTDPKAKATDDESPVPLFFPAVEAGRVSYSFALTAPGHPELLDTAEEWLTQALTLFGIGAKGTSGFGLFTVQDQKFNALPPELAEALLVIREKTNLRDLFKDFADNREKKPQLCAALLFALCEPAEEVHEKVLATYRDWQLTALDKKGLKRREKALQAMQQLAAECNYTLP